MDDRVMVCLMGASAAGKSTLAKTLQSAYPELFARVPVDFFFVPRPEDMTIEQYLAAPFRYDWDAVDRALAASGEQRSTPECDFDRLLWRADSGGLAINEAPVYLLDGMRPHPRCDLVVILEIDPIEQRRRLVERDQRWGTHVADRAAHLAATIDAGCSELRTEPALRLSATDAAEFNARQVVKLLTSSPAMTRCW